jgi:hypothetical protein
MSLKHVAPIILFLPYVIHTCMQCLNMMPIIMYTISIYLVTPR